MKLYHGIAKLINASNEPFKIKSGNSLSEIQIIENAYLIENEGEILEFGKMDSLNRDRNFDAEINCEGRFVIPLFSDSHTHLVYPKSREEEFVDRIKGLSYEEIAKNGGGILNTAKRTQETSEDHLFQSAKDRLWEIMKMGTGSVEIKSGYGLNLESELKLLRAAKRVKEISPIAIKTTFLGAHAVPKGMEKSDYVKNVINEMLPAVASEGLADYCDVFCDRGFFSYGDTIEILEAASKYGMKAKIHANELDFSGGIQAGVKSGAISVDHLECTGNEEIEALKNSETVPTLLPGTAFFLGMEYPPARKMIDSGLPVSLASDYNPGSSPSGNMAFVNSLACIKMKMLPEEAFNASTINSAYAMELGESHGGIYKGKGANFMITEAMENLSLMSYSFGRPIINKVIIQGKEI